VARSAPPQSPGGLWTLYQSALGQVSMLLTALGCTSLRCQGRSSVRWRLGLTSIGVPGPSLGNPPVVVFSLGLGGLPEGGPVAGQLSGTLREVRERERALSGTIVHSGGSRASNPPSPTVTAVGDHDICSSGFGQTFLRPGLRLGAAPFGRCQLVRDTDTSSWRPLGVLSSCRTNPPHLGGHDAPQGVTWLSRGAWEWVTSSLSALAVPQRCNEKS